MLSTLIMDDLLLTRLIISFFVAGFVIIAVVYAAERYGTRVGGIIAGAPSVVGVALLLQAIFYGSDHAHVASLGTLLAMPVLGAFCICYILLAKHNPFFSIPAASIAWLFAAYIVNEMEIQGLRDVIIFSIVVCGGTKTLLLLMIKYRIFHLKEHDDVPAKDNIFSKRSTKYIIRFLLGGTFVAVSILVAEYSNKTLAGLFAAFPAIGISNLIILRATKSPDFVSSFTYRYFSNAILHSTVYILIVYATYPVYGYVFGTIMALAASCITIMIAEYINHRHRRHIQKGLKT